MLHINIVATFHRNVSEDGHSSVTARYQKHFAEILQYYEPYKVNFQY